MKTSHKAFVLVLMSGVLFSMGLAAQSGELNGMVYETNWGPVYMGYWDDGFGAVVYESDSQIGIIDCQIVDGKLDGNWYQFNLDFEPTGSGGVNFEFTSDSQGFSGSWSDSIGNYGGEWNGSLDRMFSSDDKAYFESIVLALQSLAE